MGIFQLYTFLLVRYDLLGYLFLIFIIILIWFNILKYLVALKQTQVLQIIQVLKIAHNKMCSLLPKVDIIAAELSNFYIITIC